MKVKLASIINSVEGLNNILKKELPVKAAYWLTKLSHKLESEIKQFTETRNRLIKKYGEQKDNDWLVNPEDKEKYEKFKNEMEELLNTEVDIDINPIAIKQLGDVKISAIDMMAIEPFLTDIEAPSNTN